MSAADLEQAALQLPNDQLIGLVDRLYESINRSPDAAAAERIALADAREQASELDPDGDVSFDEFIGELKATL
ncbi:MAG: hypothetical protein ACI8UO_003105 [Verrucomicrobiales bacterium]|jgi:hypothetical protein